METPISQTEQDYRNRQNRAIAQLRERKLSAFLVTNLQNIYYLTGFRGSAGVLLLGAVVSRLWVDPRYTLQAQVEGKGVEVIEERGRLLKSAATYLKKAEHARAGKAGIVGLEEGYLTWAAFKELRRVAPGDVRFKPAGGRLVDLHSVKDPHDNIYIRRESEFSC